MSLTSYERHTTFKLPSFWRDLRSLSFSADARYIAYIGPIDVEVMDIETGSTVSFTDSAMEKLVFSTSAWVFFETLKTHVLILGSRGGELCILTLLDAKWGEPKIIDFKRDHRIRELTHLKIFQHHITAGSFTRVAVAYGGLVEVWRLSTSGDLTREFATEVTLHPMSSCSALVFAQSQGLHVVTTNGFVVTLNADVGSVESIKATGLNTIGHAILDIGMDILIMENGTTLECLLLSDMEDLGSLQATSEFTPIARTWRANRVVVGTGANGQGYIGVGANGQAYIVGVGTSPPERLRLSLSEGEDLQSISAARTNKVDRLAIGTFDPVRDRSSISIFQRRRSRPHGNIGVQWVINTILIGIVVVAVWDTLHCLV